MRKIISILIIGIFLLSILAIASCEKKGTSEDNDVDLGESNQSSESIKYRSASRTNSELKGGLFTNSEDSNAVDDLEIEYEKQK